MVSSCSEIWNVCRRMSAVRGSHRGCRLAWDQAISALGSTIKMASLLAVGSGSSGSSNYTQVIVLSSDVDTQHLERIDVT
jgi:hypothetical protein